MKLLKKSLTVTALGLGLAFVGSNAFAADLANGNGQSCTGDGMWHFVNPQSRTATPGRLDVMYLPAPNNDQTGIGPSTVNRNNQHFIVYTVGAATLYSASTNLNGRLVLSDFECDTKCEKDCEPPPCDGKDCPQ